MMNKLVLRFAAVILGAGASMRMGRPKLLLAWGQTSVVGHLLRQWQAIGAEQIAVVCAGSDRALPDELDQLARFGLPKVERIINPAPERGMFSSIQSAARWAGWNAGLSHWVIALGDQPHLRPETLRALLNFSEANPDKICQPSRNGRGRHPVILPASAFFGLKDSPAENLKQFLVGGGLAVARRETDDPGLDLDLDEPADYERALALENDQ